MAESAQDLSSTTTAVTLRPPRVSDGRHLHSLVERSRTLDINSIYSYLLLGVHFSATSAVAERDSRVVGFVSGYRKPNDPSVWFIWQIAVDAAAQGNGIAKRLIFDVIARSESDGIRLIETTVTPSNDPSWALFRSVAADMAVPLEHSTIFHEDDFGRDQHEPEALLRIGPFKDKGDQ
jgi:L-2,4-diaminobutyric acid acetyltransferase